MPLGIYTIHLNLMKQKKIIKKVSEYTPTVDDIQLVQLLADDRRVAEIAAETKQEVKAVEYQIATLKTKVGVKTLGGLVGLFGRNNLVK